MEMLFDNILVKPYVKEVKTDSGIILPHDEWGVLSKGEVVLVGKGRKLKNGTHKKPDINVGDYVVYPRDNFRKTIKHNDIDCQVLLEDQILAIIDDLNAYVDGIDREA